MAIAGIELDKMSDEELRQRAPCLTDGKPLVPTTATSSGDVIPKPTEPEIVLAK